MKNFEFVSIIGCGLGLLSLLSSAAASTTVTLPFPGCASTTEIRGEHLVIKCKGFNIVIPKPPNFHEASAAAEKAASEPAVKEQAAPVVPTITTINHDQNHKKDQESAKSVNPIDVKDELAIAKKNTEHEGDRTESEAKIEQDSSKKTASPKNSPHDKIERKIAYAGKLDEAVETLQTATMNLECHELHDISSKTETDGIQVAFQGRNYFCKRI